MSIESAKACFGAQDILLEQLIPDHIFLYVTEGFIECYDGHKIQRLNKGEYCMARKNRLARYYGAKGAEYKKIIFCFDEPFLRDFQERHKLSLADFNVENTFVPVIPNDMIPAFIESLAAYTDDHGRLNEAFEDVKYEELLIILLKNQPELAGLFFDYAEPQKVNLEKFMTRNYKFNMRLERFAYLTGRSLSTFKRDFKAIFNDAPNHWLVKRRLEEAYILIQKENKKASEIYLDLGFEDLSHFSLAFKNQFGLRPTELAEKRNK